MSDFKWRHFNGTVILHCVRWYYRYGISYRDLEEMMEEHGEILITRRFIIGFNTTQKRLRWQWRRPCWSDSWKVDETYIKVRDTWIYLY